VDASGPGIAAGLQIRFFSNQELDE